MPPNSFALRVLICSLLLCAIGRGTQATTITVINTNDSGAGSLRQALAVVNDGDTIDFDSALNGQTITLTTAELLINKSITVMGPGANLLTVARAENASNFRIFHVMPAHTVTIQGLTITRGFNHFGFVSGGGIYNDHSNVTVNSCILTDNSARGRGFFSGGAIGNDAGFSGSASLTINDSIIDGNNIDDGITANVGGGIYNFALGGGTGTVTINNSTISNNRAYQGGGVYSDGSNNGHAVITVTNSTFSSNAAEDGGGIVNNGIEAGDATLIVANSTFSGNSATPNLGGAVLNVGDSGANDGIVQLGDTILKAGLSGANIYNDGGTIISHGYNISSDNGGGFLTGPGDQTNTDPLLGPAPE